MMKMTAGLRETEGVRRKGVERRASFPVYRLTIVEADRNDVLTTPPCEHSTD